jgi:hypothetical protein
MQLPRAVDGEEVSLAPPVNAPLLPASRRAPPHPTPPRGTRRRTAEAGAEAEGLEAATQFSGEGRGRAGVPLAAGRSPRRAGRRPSRGANEAAGRRRPCRLPPRRWRRRPHEHQRPHAPPCSARAGCGFCGGRALQGAAEPAAEAAALEWCEGQQRRRRERPRASAAKRHRHEPLARRPRSPPRSQASGLAHSLAHGHTSGRFLPPVPCEALTAAVLPPGKPPTPPRTAAAKMRTSAAAAAAGHQIGRRKRCPSRPQLRYLRALSPPPPCPVPAPAYSHLHLLPSQSLSQISAFSGSLPSPPLP